MNVIIVEDDFLTAHYLADACRRLGLDVVARADNAADATRSICAIKPNYVLMDVRLRGAADGVQAAIDSHPACPATKFIYVTGSSEQSTRARIEMDHPHRILIKPVSDADLDGAFAAA